MANVFPVFRLLPDKKALNLVKGTWYTPDGDKVVFSGKKVNYYFSDSENEPYWIFDIDEIIKTSYGYYFKNRIKS